MRIHALQHVPFEGLAAIGPVLDRLGSDVVSVRLFAGDRLPSADETDAVIVMGGPMGVDDGQAHPWLGNEKHFLRDVIDRDIPLLGICLGAQLIASALGAKVGKNPEPEIGWFPISKRPEADRTAIGQALPDQLTVFHWHGDTFDLPDDAVPLYHSEACRNQGFVAGRNIVGLQFHFEMTRDAVAGLVAHAADELVDAPYVQTRDQLLANERHFVENGLALESLVTTWLSK